MSEENVFKFGLYQEDSIVSETIFSADMYNPVVRYSVDIRSDISKIISNLQRVLSTKNDFLLNFNFDFGNVKYNSLEEYKASIQEIDTQEFITKLSKPNIKKKTIKGKVISGAEFKFGLYINDNPIVERVFYVSRYNPKARFSLELASAINDIINEIQSQLKESDVKHMWDDYELINNYGMYINQIRDLSKNKRNKLLEDIKNKN